MKRKTALFIVLTAALILPQAAYGASADLVEGMGAKLSRGVVDFFTGWIEVPAQAVKGYKDGYEKEGRNRIGGAAAGLLEGLYYAAGRTASGIREALTFWAANPLNNEETGIPFDGERAWDEGGDYDFFYPGFTEGTLKPMEAKLMRGVANGFLSFMEIPGQIMKGADEDAPDLGIIKGLWYAASRAASGLGDILTAPLPNHMYQEGLPFDEQWPWDALSRKSDFR